MIEASELRKGNWVIFSPSGKRHLVMPRKVKIKELLEKSTITDDSGLSL